MTLCNSRKEIAALWPDKKRKIALSKLPNKFPCLVAFRYLGFELLNGYYSLEVCYPPDGVDLESFKKGMAMAAKTEFRNVTK